MWISSFVVTLPSDAGSATRVVQAIDAIAVFQSGECMGERLPVVLEVSDGSEARYWYEWVSALPGVVKVDLAFVSFEDEPGEMNSAENDASELLTLQGSKQI